MKYVCECDHEWCRDGFEMPATTYRDVVLADARVVLRGHKGRDDIVLAAVNGVQIVRRDDVRDKRSNA